MAVAVEAVPYVVLDEKHRIVEVGPAASAQLGSVLGQSIMDRFPGSSAFLRPYFEQAQRTGEVVEFAQYYDGYVAHIKVVPTGGRRLVLSWELLCMLDVLTLDGLRASLNAIVDALQAREDALRREVVRRSLHVVEGSL